MANGRFWHKPAVHRDATVWQLLEQERTYRKDRTANARVRRDARGGDGGFR